MGGAPHVQNRIRNFPPEQAYTVHLIFVLQPCSQAWQRLTMKQTTTGPGPDPCIPLLIDPDADGWDKIVAWNGEQFNRDHLAWPGLVSLNSNVVFMRSHYFCIYLAPCL